MLQEVMDFEVEMISFTRSASPCTGSNCLSAGSDMF